MTDPRQDNPRGRPAPNLSAGLGGRTGPPNPSRGRGGMSRGGSDSRGRGGISRGGSDRGRGGASRGGGFSDRDRGGGDRGRGRMSRGRGGSSDRGGRGGFSDRGRGGFSDRGRGRGRGGDRGRGGERGRGRGGFSDRGRGGFSDRGSNKRSFGGSDGDTMKRRMVEPAADREERDKRTILVQQLSQKVTETDLKEFFERIGKVNHTQIVKDRASGRPKGIAYVEFDSPASVKAALKFTGETMYDIPIIVEYTDTEKSRQAYEFNKKLQLQIEKDSSQIYFGNVAFTIDEAIIEKLFEAFGKISKVQLIRNEDGKSQGYGFIKFMESDDGKEAMTNMNGFYLMNRNIRLGYSIEKVSSLAILRQRNLANQNAGKRPESRPERNPVSHKNTTQNLKSGASTKPQVQQKSSTTKPSSNQSRKPDSNTSKAQPEKPAKPAYVPPSNPGFAVFACAEEQEAIHEIEGKLREAFNGFGRICHFFIQDDFGYVKFEEAESVDKLVNEWNEKTFNDQALIVDEYDMSEYYDRFPEAKDL